MLQRSLLVFARFATFLCEEIKASTLDQAVVSELESLIDHALIINEGPRRLEEDTAFSHSYYDDTIPDYGVSFSYDPSSSYSYQGKSIMSSFSYDTHTYVTNLGSYENALLSYLYQTNDKRYSMSYDQVENAFSYSYQRDMLLQTYLYKVEKKIMTSYDYGRSGSYEDMLVERTASYEYSSPKNSYLEHTFSYSYQTDVLLRTYSYKVEKKIMTSYDYGRFGSYEDILMERTASYEYSSPKNSYYQDIASLMANASTNQTSYMSQEDSSTQYSYSDESSIAGSYSYDHFEQATYMPTVSSSLVSSATRASELSGGRGNGKKYVLSNRTYFWWILAALILGGVLVGALIVFTWTKCSNNPKIEVRTPTVRFSNEDTNQPVRVFNKKEQNNDETQWLDPMDLSETPYGQRKTIYLPDGGILVPADEDIEFGQQHSLAADLDVGIGSLLRRSIPHPPLEETNNPFDDNDFHVPPRHEPRGWADDMFTNTDENQSVVQNALLPNEPPPSFPATTSVTNDHSAHSAYSPLGVDFSHERHNDSYDQSDDEEVQATL